MKKFAGKIAVILIILMLAGSLTGCFTMWGVQEGGDAYWLIIFPVLPALDIVTSPIQLIIFIVELSRYQDLKDRAKKMDTVDSFSANISSIPETDLLSLKEKINSLPETEISVFSRKVNSFSETEISAIIEAFNNLSEAEIDSSMETLNSMSDEMLITAINNSQYIEFRYHNKRRIL